MSSHVELRAISTDELSLYVTRLLAEFGTGSTHEEDLLAYAPLIEVDRSLAAFEGDSMVATAGIISMSLTVPNEVRVPAAGVSRVTVLPTHRRRGLLRRLMERQLADLHESGESIAVLYTTEGPIYGRFGYGLASYAAQAQIDRRSGSFNQPLPRSGARLVSAAEALSIFPGLCDRYASLQPGMICRDKSWWEVRLEDPPFMRRGASDNNLVLHVGPDGPDGYAVYRKEIDYTDTGLTGVVHLFDLLAMNPLAYAVLWRYVLDLDLITKVVGHKRSVDEPLRHLLVDPRALAVNVYDGLWLRLVDLATALQSRQYQREGHVALRVSDTFCPWNSGTYVLDADPSGCRCKPSNVEPDLVLSVGSLSACYLGGNRFSTLHRAGLIEERRPGAVALADSMFASAVTPWCPFHF